MSEIDLKFMKMTEEERKLLGSVYDPKKAKKKKTDGNRKRVAVKKTKK